MSETTEILFNSPALHSLRRDQLQKLCKLHSIKANGKNTELIDKLKRHALTLPKDDPLSIAARSEQPEGSCSDSSSMRGSEMIDEGMSMSEGESPVKPQAQVQRPSEQWEVVMESIQEVEEHTSNGNLSSLRTPGPKSSGEFGTANSKTSTMTSSIRALASSLGFKKAAKSTESSSLSSNTYAIPYSATKAATPPLNDNFTFDPTTAPHIRMSFDANGEPLPGCSLRPGEPAPENARLSMGVRPGAAGGGQQSQQPKVEKNEEEQPTTTIRLVSKGSSSSLEDDAPNPDMKKDVFHTPKLKPFATSFDLLMSPSPNKAAAAAGSKTPFWAPTTRSGPFKSIYPTLTINDLPPDVPPSPLRLGGNKTATVTNEGKDTLEVPTLTITTTNTLSNTTTTNTNTNANPRTTPEPFLFGSPRHSVTNTEFKAAATSVLEEMNKRLLGSGVEGVGMDLVAKLQPGAHTEAQLREVKSLPRSSGGVGGKGNGEITKKFDEKHQAEFDKMEGIDGTLKRRKQIGGDVKPLAVAGKKRKSNVLGELGDGSGKPRRPTAGPASSSGAKAVTVSGGRTSGTTRVISNGRRGMGLPGAFGDEDEEEEEEAAIAELIQEIAEEAESGEEGGRGGKRARIDPEASPTINTDTNATQAKGKGKGKGKARDENAMDVDNQDHQDEAEEQRRKSRQLEKEREVIKRKLEISRAKRKSSVGGVVNAATKSAAVAASRRNSRVPATPKSKPSRFGFLTSAKKLVASVWNRGKTPSKPTTSTTTAPSAPATGVSAPTKSSLLKRKAPTPAFAPTRNTSGTTAPGTGDKLGVPQAEGGQQKPTQGPTGSTRSRSPIPPAFSKPPSTTNTGTNTNASATAAAAGPSKMPPSIRSSSAGSNASKTGLRVPSASSSRVSSLAGTRASTNSIGGSVGLKPKSQIQVRASSFGSVKPKSRLLAPTASSLAKMKEAGGSGTNIGTAKKSLLGSITNSPRVGSGIPRRGAVLSPIGAGGRKASGQAANVLSPRNNAAPTKIFSKPVVGGLAKSGGEGGEDVEMGDAAAGSSETGVAGEDGLVGNAPGGTSLTRQRTFTRKPRISRSKVIARLASQRAAATSSSAFKPTKHKAGAGSVDLARLPNTPSHKPGFGVSATPVRASGGGMLRGKRTRSSIGVKTKRTSLLFGDGGVGAAGARASEKERSVLASAKKRVRQSEYARRRSVRMSMASSGVSGDD